MGYCPGLYKMINFLESRKKLGKIYFQLIFSFGKPKGFSKNQTLMELEPLRTKSWLTILISLRFSKYFQEIINIDLSRPHNPPELLNGLKKDDLTPQPLEKVKIILDVSFLINTRQWFFNRNWSHCRPNLRPFFVFFSKRFLIHNVLWLSNVALNYVNIPEPIFITLKLFYTVW